MDMLLTKKEMEHVKWYDYLWLLVPIAGIAVFVLMVEGRTRRGG